MKSKQISLLALLGSQLMGCAAAKPFVVNVPTVESPAQPAEEEVNPDVTALAEWAKKNCDYTLASAGDIYNHPARIQFGNFHVTLIYSDHRHLTDYTKQSKVEHLLAEQNIPFRPIDLSQGNLLADSSDTLYLSVSGPGFNATFDDAGLDGFLTRNDFDSYNGSKLDDKRRKLVHDVYMQTVRAIKAGIDAYTKVESQFQAQLPKVSEK